MYSLTIFILGLTIIIVNAKPQGLPPPKPGSAVKVEQQYVFDAPKIENKERTLLENSSQTKSRAQNTKEILDKITKLNDQLGYTNKKGLKAIDYDENVNDNFPEGHNRALQSYPRDYNGYGQQYYPQIRPESNLHQASPFDNPITEYLKSLNEKDTQNTVFSRNGDTTAGDQFESYDNSENTMPENEDEIPKGQTIKRKIIHRQSIMIPNPLMMNFGRYPTGTQPFPLNPNSFYPGMQQYQMPGYPTYIQQPYHQENSVGFEANRRDFHSDVNGTTNHYGTLNQAPQGRQLSWPFQSYFPIVINDPFLSFYNAFSQMIEYGPEADLCKRVSNIFKGKPRPKSDENSARSGKVYNFRPSTAKPIEDDDSEGAEDSSADEIVIDQLALHIPKKNFVQSLFRPRRFPDPEEDVSLNSFMADNNTEQSQDDSRGPTSDKAFFSKDNMGNGIFIQKLKVRKGGVAIAGPGGIATAGSGGTAVVGPGGFAYTQPNGVAIAGPGAKVFSIPETHNLTEIILKAHSDGKSLNSSGEPRSLPPGSKVVAIGPTVYHNTGNE